MPLLSHKFKQFLVFSIKIVIVGGAFFFIYNELTNKDNLDWDKFLIVFHKNQSFLGVFFILYLSFQNRFLEILKWQNLVSSFKTITIGTASKQVLAALTAGIFTPNGIGEYAGKALYFDRIYTKKIVFLNLLCNGIQLVLSVGFGAIGLFYLGYRKWVLVIFLTGIAILLMLYFLKSFVIKGFSLNDLFQKIKEISSKIHKKNIGLGLLRYLTFSHQYYFLFVAFDVNLPYFTLMATIAAVYFLASSLPSFQFLDFAVKGSVAVYFFNILGVNQWIVVFVTALMWFLNVVIPVFIGSFYVLNFKMDKK